MIIPRGVCSPQRTQRTQRKIHTRSIPWKTRRRLALLESSTRVTVWTARTGLILCVLCVLCGEPSAAGGQEPAAPQAVSAAQLTAAINKLGDLNYAVRTGASRTVRRAPAAQAVPALIQA